MLQKEKEFLGIAGLLGIMLGGIALMFGLSFLLAFLKIPILWSLLILIAAGGGLLILLYTRRKSRKQLLFPVLFIVAGGLIIYPFWSGILEAEQRPVITGISVDNAVKYNNFEGFSFTNGRILRGKGGTYTDEDGMGYYVAPLVSRNVYDKTDPVPVYVCIKSEGSQFLATEPWDNNYSGGVRISPDDKANFLKAVDFIENTHGLSPHPDAVLIEWTNPLTQAENLRGFILLTCILSVLVMTVYFLISSFSVFREMRMEQKQRAFNNRC